MTISSLLAFHLQDFWLLLCDDNLCSAHAPSSWLGSAILWFRQKCCSRPQKGHPPPPWLQRPFGPETVFSMHKSVKHAKCKILLWQDIAILLPLPLLVVNCRVRKGTKTMTSSVHGSALGRMGEIAVILMNAEARFLRFSGLTKNIDRHSVSVINLPVQQISSQCNRRGFGGGGMEAVPNSDSHCKYSRIRVYSHLRVFFSQQQETALFVLASVNTLANPRTSAIDFVCAISLRKNTRSTKSWFSRWLQEKYPQVWIGYNSKLFFYHYENCGGFCGLWPHAQQAGTTVREGHGGRFLQWLFLQFYPHNPKLLDDWILNRARVDFRDSRSQTLGVFSTGEIDS